MKHHRVSYRAMLALNFWQYRIIIWSSISLSTILKKFIKRESHLGNNGPTICLNLSKLWRVGKCTNQEGAIWVPVRLVFCSHFQCLWSQIAALRINKSRQHKHYPFLPTQKGLTLAQSWHTKQHTKPQKIDKSHFISINYQKFGEVRGGQTRHRIIFGAFLRRCIALTSFTAPFHFLRLLAFITFFSLTIPISTRFTIILSWTHPWREISLPTLITTTSQTFLCIRHIKHH